MYIFTRVYTKYTFIVHYIDHSALATKELWFKIDSPVDSSNLSVLTSLNSKKGLLGPKCNENGHIQSWPPLQDPPPKNPCVEVLEGSDSFPDPRGWNMDALVGWLMKLSYECCVEINEMARSMRDMRDKPHCNLCSSEKDPNMFNLILSLQLFDRALLAQVLGVCRCDRTIGDIKQKQRNPFSVNWGCLSQHLVSHRALGMNLAIMISDLWSRFDSLPGVRSCKALQYIYIYT